MFRKILNTRYINILVLLSAVDVNQNIYTLWSRSCYLTALILYPMGTMYGIYLNGYTKYSVIYAYIHSKHG